MEGQVDEAKWMKNNGTAVFMGSQKISEKNI
jgi:hypothetical protein